MTLRIPCLLLIATMYAIPAYPQRVESDFRQLIANSEEGVRQFYSTNGYSLAWKDAVDVLELTSAVRAIGLEGLDPQNYHLSQLEEPLAQTADDRTRVVRDLLLTGTFLQLAHDLYEGRLNPAELFPGDWDACTRKADYAGLLRQALDEGSICETLDFLKPMDNGYEGLKYMLDQFKKIREGGDFPPIPLGIDIKPGDVDERMSPIRTKLFMLRLIPEGLANESIVYDSTLLFAIQKFQRRHHLPEDGVIGHRTQQALVLQAKDYIESIVANLERYRWHQSRLMERGIRINIPAAELTVTDGDRVELQMKVITGRVDRRTPVLSSAISLITLNPTWTVPPTILKEDVLPAVFASRDYLTQHQMKLFDRKGVEIHPDSVQWQSYSTNTFPFTIRQDAGPRNPLGLIKFSFPNDHAVYLHDTNVPSLFANQDRALSSGCIRIESPMSLVRILTEGSEITEETLQREIALGETKLILLKRAMPIHITYFTAYVNNDEFYVARDVYRYDRVILDALLRTCKSRL